jgi:hypothetical protein
MERHAMVEPRTARIVRMERLSFSQAQPLTNLFVGINGRTPNVVPPGNEGLSDDVGEKKGRFLSSTGVSQDLIENTPLTP